MYVMHACMYVFMYACTTCMHGFIKHTYIHTCMHACMHACMHTFWLFVQIFFRVETDIHIPHIYLSMKPHLGLRSLYCFATCCELRQCNHAPHMLSVFCNASKVKIKISTNKTESLTNIQKPSRTQIHLKKNT